jgi:hypothetical protein
MVLDWLAKGKAKTVPELLVRRQFAQAVERAQAELKARPRSARLTLQLADTLEAAGRGKEAVPLFKAMADELARDGFAAKAIALLKRIQKIDPQAKVDTRVAGLIQEGTRRPVFDPPTIVPRARDPRELEEPEELGIEPPDEIGIELPRPRELELPAPATSPPDDLGLEGAAQGARETPGPREEPASEEVETIDLALSTVQDDAAPIRATPLFPDFSQEELLAVIQGLELLTYGPGEIVVAEGEPGGSLYLLTTGTVKAWTKDARGHYVLARSMHEGDFFGEVSVLTGQARTATVTTATRCELLELDRPTLDGITTTHPRVREVLQRFYEERVGK